MHIACFSIGWGSIEVDDLRFLSNDNLIDYDILIWDVSNTINEIRSDINRALFDKKEMNSSADSRVEEINRLIDFRKEQLVEFLRNQGKIVVFVTDNYSIGEDEFSSKLIKPFSLNLLQLLGSEFSKLELGKLIGTKVRASYNLGLDKFLKDYPDIFRHEFYLMNSIGQKVLQTIKSNKTLGFYERKGKGTILFIPQLNANLHPGLPYLRGRFLTFLMEMNFTDQEQGDEVVFPNWTNQINVGDEYSLSKNLTKKLKDLEALNASIEVMKGELDGLVYFKRLICSGDDVLELAVKQAFKLIGFNALPVSTKKRADLLFEIGNSRVVLEVKGVNGSAAEKHASQLEKWVNEERDDELGLPKGILLVNTFKNLPISERTEPSFPNQMLKFSEKRDHCLMTGYDLLQMVSLFMKGEISKEQITELLISTVGVLKIKKADSDNSKTAL